MRKRIVAGNWKMNTTVAEGLELAQAVNEKAAKRHDETVGVAIAPPLTHLNTIISSLETTDICIAAQNCSAEASGAYTGEVSAKTLADMGVNAVIIGHSERRAYYHEDHAFLAQKVNRVLENNMKAIFCCGEVLSEREANRQNEIVSKQLADSLYHLNNDQIEQVVIAYEPVWAIGTGVTASSDQAQEMHAFIRAEIKNKYGAEVAENMTILYGGSCKPTNAQELFSNPDVDGGLIGGASLKADDFMGIVNAF